MYNQTILKGFADATQSLKLYRRAELREAETAVSLIEQLYVDPLQHDAVLETTLRPNTTLIVGRKGTGKSTVFQRAQHEIRGKRRQLSAYIDIKTVYESAVVDPQTAETLAATNISVTSETELTQILLYRAFSRAIFSEIQKELKDQINGSWFERAKEALGAKRSDVIEALDTLLDGAFDAEFFDITKLARTDIKSGSKHTDQSKARSGGKLASSLGLAGVSAKSSVSASQEDSLETSTSEEKDYSRILLRTFSINSIMERLSELLASIGVNHLFVFIDDFSELPEAAMRVFVDAILAPLNNWSNELFKFKVAAYPGRVYLGKIDPTKIDEVYLDTFRLYGTSDVTTMEEKAIDFTKRLLENRFDHYVKVPFERFCEGDMDEIYRQMFFASAGNARNLGHILHNLRESHISYGNSVGVRAIGEASRKYYEEKIEPFFGVQKFAHESFGERSSIFSLKELLESIVTRAKDLRNTRTPPSPRTFPDARHQVISMSYPKWTAFSQRSN